MEGQSDPLQHLIDTAVEAATAMTAVIENWESGDLAAAVRDLKPVHLANVAALLTAHIANNVRNRGKKMELHVYPNRHLDAYERMFLNAANNMGSDGDLEFDDVTVISESDDNGEYVLGWKWVANSDVGFMTRYKAVIYYQDDEQVKHHLATDSCMAYDEMEARDKLLDRHWDSRLDSASCQPILEWQKLETTEFTVTVVDRDDDNEYEEIMIEAVDLADVVVALRELYDSSQYRIDDDNGEEIDPPETEEARVAPNGNPEVPTKSG